MFWKRLLICGVPVLILALGIRMVRHVREQALQPATDKVSLAVAADPDVLNPFRRGNPAAELVEGVIFSRLLERDDSLVLKPALLESWDVSQRTRYFFVAERHAQEGMERIQDLREKWPEWGVSGLLAEKDEVRVIFENPAREASEEIYALFDESKLLPVRRLRVQVLHSARESFRDFKQNSFEGAQVRGEWFSGNSLYEVMVAGETENFFREFGMYHTSNDSLGASFRFVEDLPYLEEPEMLLTLRAGVTWHDGTPLTSADVVFSFDLCKRQPWDAHLRDVFSSVLALSAPDASTVRVVYRNRAPMAVETWAILPVLPRHVLEGKDEAWWAEHFERMPVGSGPFRMGEREPGRVLVLERNEDYYLGPPRTERLVVWEMADAAERRMRLATRQIDSYIAGAGERRFLGRDARFEMWDASLGRLRGVFWNPGRGPYTDARLREALARAVAPEALYPEREDSPAGAVGGLFHPGSIYAGAGCERMKFDPALAMKLCGESGWVRNAEGALIREGERLVLKLGVSEDVPSGIPERLKKAWSRIGVEVETEPFPAALFDRAGEGGFFGSDFDAVLLALPPPVDWVSFRHGTLGRLALEAVENFAVGEGKPREIRARLEEAVEEGELRMLCGELEAELCARHLFAFLHLDREARAFRRGSIFVSRSVGDGQRVEKPLTQVAAGIDLDLSWWAKMSAEGEGPGKDAPGGIK